MMNLPPQLNGQQSQSPMGMPSQMQQEEESAKEEITIVGHFKPEELVELDEAQGGIVIDPETGLRDYTPLSKFMQNPEVRAAVSQAFPPNDQQSFAEGGQVEEMGRPTDPELEKLRLEGRGGDTELAIITPELLELFTEWSGKEPTINPVTGLPEFFSFSRIFRSVARIAAPIIGAVFGGPAGAALAGGLATKLTGGSWGQSLGAGALGGLGAFAAPALGSAFQSAFPGAAGALGSAAKGILGDTVGGALGNLFTPGAGTTGGGLISGLGGVGRMLPGMGAQAATQGIGQVAAQAAPQAAGQMGGGFLGALTKGLPLLGAGLMLAKGHQDDKRNTADYENKQRQESDSIRNKLGFNSPLKPAKPFEYGEENFDIPRSDYKRGKIPRFFNYDLAEKYAADGGPIRGSGKGQQDNIPTNLEDGSYIIDASTVSDIGDGSTDAGFKELDQYSSTIPSQNIPSKAQGGYIQAMVSNGEYKFSPEQVTALGNGSNERGAKMLDHLVKQVRAKKRTSGKKLPPKSKPIGSYLKKLHAA
jgi:hypothetical protein